MPGKRLVRLRPIRIGLVQEQIGIEHDIAIVLHCGKRCPRGVFRGLRLEVFRGRRRVVAHGNDENEIGIKVDDGFQAEIGQQALILVRQLQNTPRECPTRPTRI